ncbi:MAG: transporter substrate-binding domain-containing protein [Succinivibrio sp.]|nr:transporter substrate-binding domain-containing protein [Succinivibrio sp.]
MRLITKATLLGLTLFSASVFASGQKTLKVGIEDSIAPFEFREKGSTEVIGFDVDIIKAIAKEQGFAVEITNMPFDALLPSVLTEQVDVAISSYSITEERAKIVKLEPYYDSGLGVLVRTDLLKDIHSSYDLQGRTICAKSGTTGSYFAENIKKSKTKNYLTEIEAFMSIDKGECDVVIIDKPVLEYYHVRSHDDKTAVLKDKLTFEQYGIVTSKNKGEISDNIAEGLKKIRKNGIYDQIYRKWFENTSNK